MKRGLKPVGLLTSVGLTSEEVSSAGVFVAILVTPALKRGLNPVGLFASVLSLVLSTEGDESSLFSVAGAAFVTPALKRGLNPAGLFVSAGDVVLSASFFCTSSAAELFAAAAKRGLKPVGAAFAVSALGVLLGSFFFWV
ncbi:hypothetical protein [Sphingobacterium sp. T2]|uniref:hypothetical protein n=1 Tax=Sphingobacterium sp. T2 TaxID=1590596 RepID=UPI00057B87C5|nr:hypothetical protein [Sphingobacterium sp. T2]